ncbi:MULTISPECIES: bifunctional phosphopantothenoylcysteine decarboxylase/phosphopantothenate--cysteine ligase CoaBC [unclassified Methylophaga]|jgi:phosphopantothenoylcysteine decarboxylase/phosphopantothenate--cysteine ligase|uniref:bifunctional phosphopantothenoylcysteine decarboxylase/phosphopantothenate--cysteine ligase CoaBC n=3 Tax=Methylophaga TaxID=40222 RepID=UPI000C934D95|nr:MULTISPECIES: bifunctional phosphopantothenoylcysteine decarboxylase/phosphopantothenate--cysteine ligase CoaBC [unclassified Methylophaga]MAK67399.1 bifunctional phosphopantothenoylcysteine decarboxylase/phosphopantothenate--cysteine ligase CoaBC [Methylophaga sp.]MAY16939.1 bifunctional phosphopantothenoylcysteine decarboxylase/phosphopantothenate--cysteine ligase CoaBC [Methylophaga sp.]MBN46546.1 bifunctional phosphopantothenoylcysteine decarboxylase/phosphopantothenate--cysteine ligase C|tara:strand:- start:70422 stop:71642 length:1221 start_codon:yes stop_codon:yes gene_type:complete
MIGSNAFRGKHILLGITGSIAAYKAADLVRRLKEHGAEVRVMMSHGATQFITPLTMQTVSGHPVSLNFFDADEEAAMGHIKLARWADWIVIAPATADCLAKLTHGHADDLISTVCLASEAPLILAPAMNNKMWSHPATQQNYQLLKQRGVEFFGPESGDQACGEQGEGRLMAVDAIVSLLLTKLQPGPLSGTQLLITAGPTYEPIDPVRFIANRSSGKMGYALAQAAVEAGANVTLISGPVALGTPDGVNRVDVETAQQMYDAVMQYLTQTIIFIGCAAVADYRPAHQAQAKLKKSTNNDLTLQLQLNPDIINTVANSDNRPELVVGFAAETDDLQQYAQQKLQQKRLDLIAANRVGDRLAFGQENNALEIFWEGGHKSLTEAPKLEIARELIKVITERYHAKNSI